ncbi:MAG: hypothetical protein IT306_10525 [Chloroflexi bacterium]|nr:hypothetical protein [Chloroflexota bacterium]
MPEAALASCGGPADAAVEIVVRVTLADIAAAAADPRGGPLAAALARLGYADVGVGVREVLLRPAGGPWLSAVLPPSAAALVDDADAGRAVRPVAFRLRARAVPLPR